MVNLYILALRPPVGGSSEWECDLSRVVQRVQQHVCIGKSSCRKKQNGCRFVFPKILQDRTVVETSISTDGTPSFKVKLKRKVSTINSYSLHLISCLRANMDLQLIGNAYGAAEYAGAYISKAEPDTLRLRRVIAKAIQRCDPNLPYHSILKRVANSTLSVQNVGAPEAIYILLRNLAMHSKSRVIKKVKILLHHVQDMDDLAALAEPVDPDAIRIEPIERAYMNRPSNELFHSMNFATFVEEYEEVDLLNENADRSNTWTRSDGEGLIRRRKKPVFVQKSPWMRPNSSSRSFCFSDICLYVPWWSVDDLPNTDEDCIAQFREAQNMQLDGELQKESNARLARQHQLDLLKNARDNAMSFRLRRPNTSS
jgi:hypothetical protein